MVSIADSYQPDATRHEQYQFYVKKYQETYQHIKNVMHDVTLHT
jgi:sugar (pentulose or hexulose) kinase